MPIINVLWCDVLQVFGLSDHAFSDLNREKQQSLEEYVIKIVIDLSSNNWLVN